MVSKSLLQGKRTFLVLKLWQKFMTYFHKGISLVQEAISSNGLQHAA